MFTDFLNLNELNILHTMPKGMLTVPFYTFGGYDSAERQIAGFLPDAFYLYTENESRQDLFPISILKIEPLHSKFAEELSHRDYLGALLSLGIERGKLGDILLSDGCAYVICVEKMAVFLCENLTRIRRTSVTADVVDKSRFKYVPEFETICGTVASVRLDSLLGLAFHSSRSRLAPLIEAGKVYVNGRLMTSNGYQVKECDIISVRGMGRFCYRGSLSETKKGRIYVQVDRYTGGHLE